jgi:hypothetical protein
MGIWRAAPGRPARDDVIEVDEFIRMRLRFKLSHCPGPRVVVSS